MQKKKKKKSMLVSLCKTYVLLNMLVETNIYILFD